MSEESLIFCRSWISVCPPKELLKQCDVLNVRESTCSPYVFQQLNQQGADLVEIKDYARSIVDLLKKIQIDRESAFVDEVGRGLPSAVVTPVSSASFTDLFVTEANMESPDTPISLDSLDIGMKSEDLVLFGTSSDILHFQEVLDELNSICIDMEADVLIPPRRLQALRALIKQRIKTGPDMTSIDRVLLWLGVRESNFISICLFGNTLLIITQILLLVLKVFCVRRRPLVFSECTHRICDCINSDL